MGRRPRQSRRRRRPGLFHRTTPRSRLHGGLVRGLPLASATRGSRRCDRARDSAVLDDIIGDVGLWLPHDAARRSSAEGTYATTLTVLESACPVVHGGPKTGCSSCRSSPTTRASSGTGGLQGAFPIVAGASHRCTATRISFAFNRRRCRGELEREVGAIARSTATPPRVCARRAGGSRRRSVQAYELDPHGVRRHGCRRATRSRRGYARVAAVSGSTCVPSAAKRSRSSSSFSAAEHRAFPSRRSRPHLRGLVATRRVGADRRHAGLPPR